MLNAHARIGLWVIGSLRQNMTLLPALLRFMTLWERCKQNDQQHVVKTPRCNALEPLPRIAFAGVAG